MEAAGPARAATPTGGALRAHRRDVGLEVVRSGSALVGAVTLAAVPGAGGAAVAHGLLLAGSLGVLLLLARGARCTPLAGALLTAGTLASWVAASAAWHDVPGAGTTLGVLALVEAPSRYGLRGALVSGPLVTGTALLLPQVAADGSTQGTGTVLLLVAVLLAGSVWVRHGGERAATGAERAEAAVADALAALPVGVAVLDAEGQLLHTNSRFGELLQGEPPDLRPLLAAPGPEGTLELERSGRRLALGAARTAQGRVVVHVEDVTATRLERERLDRLATVDRLTGLTSRAAGEDALRRRGHEDGRYAVLFVDLDGVKRLNDLRGHAAGDLVLAESARRLQAVLRAGDTAVRWGGDEFVVLLEGADEGTGLAVAERVRRALRAPVVLTDAVEVVPASLGLALSEDDHDDLVGAADAAMYSAKRAGGDRVVLAGGQPALLPAPPPAPRPAPPAAPRPTTVLLPVPARSA